jgi:hypothetical protein
MPLEITHEIWAKEFLLTEPAIGIGSYQTWPTGALTWADASMTKAAVSITDWHSFSLSVVNKLLRLPNPADGTTRTIKRAVRTLSGEITKDFGDQQEYTDITNDTAFNLVFTLGTHTFTFANSKWEDPDPPITLDDLIAKRLPFKGLTLTVV